MVSLAPALLSADSVSVCFSHTGSLLGYNSSQNLGFPSKASELDLSQDRARAAEMTQAEHFQYCQIRVPGILEKSKQAWDANSSPFHLSVQLTSGDDNPSRALQLLTSTEGHRPWAAFSLTVPAPHSPTTAALGTEPTCPQFKARVLALLLCYS